MLLPKPVTWHRYLWPINLLSLFCHLPTVVFYAELLAAANGRHITILPCVAGTTQSRINCPCLVSEFSKDKDTCAASSTCWDAERVDLTAWLIMHETSSILLLLLPVRPDLIQWHQSLFSILYQNEKAWCVSSFAFSHVYILVASEIYTRYYLRTVWYLRLEPSTAPILIFSLRNLTIFILVSSSFSSSPSLLPRLPESQ